MRKKLFLIFISVILLSLMPFTGLKAFALVPVTPFDSIAIVETEEDETGTGYCIVVTDSRVVPSTLPDPTDELKSEAAGLYLKIVCGKAIGMNMNQLDLISIIKRDLPDYVMDVFNVDDLKKNGDMISIPFDLNYSRDTGVKKFREMIFTLREKTSDLEKIKLNNIKAMWGPGSFFKSKGTLPVEMRIKKRVEGKKPILLPDRNEEKFVLNNGFLDLSGKRFLFPRITLEKLPGQDCPKSVIGLFLHDADHDQVQKIDKFMFEPDMIKFIAYEDPRVIEFEGMIYLTFTVVRNDGTYFSALSMHDSKKFLDIAEARAQGKDMEWEWSPSVKFLGGGKALRLIDKYNVYKNFVIFPAYIIIDGKSHYAALYRPDIPENIGETAGASTIRMAVSEGGPAGPWYDYCEFMDMDPDDGWQGISVSVTGTPHVNETFPFQIMIYHRARFRDFEEREKYYDNRLIVCDLNDPFNYYLSEPMITPDENKLDELGIKAWVPGVIYTCGVKLMDFDLDKNEYVFDIYYSYADAAIFMDTITVEIKPKIAKTVPAEVDDEVIRMLENGSEQTEFGYIQEDIQATVFDGVHIITEELTDAEIMEFSNNFVKALSIPDGTRDELCKKYSHLVLNSRDHLSKNGIERAFIGFKREGDYIRVTIRDLRETIYLNGSILREEAEFKSLINDFMLWDASMVTFEAGEKRIVFSMNEGKIETAEIRSVLYKGSRVTIDIDLHVADTEEISISEKISGFQVQNMNLMETVGKALGDQQVDLMIDLSLVRDDDIRENMKTWAYLMLLNNQYSLDVNFIFNNSEKTVFTEDPVIVLKGYIDELCKEFGRDTDEVKDRINHSRSDEDIIQVYILKRGALYMLDDGDPLFVAMDEREFIDNAPMWDFPGAYVLSIAQAALKKSLKDQETKTKTQNTRKLIADILPKIRMIYRKKFPGHNLDLIINADILLEMVNSGLERRRKIAEWLALPPITRRAISLSLKESHLILHLFLHSV